MVLIINNDIKNVIINLNCIVSKLKNFTTYVKSFNENLDNFFNFSIRRLDDPNCKCSNYPQPDSIEAANLSNSSAIAAILQSFNPPPMALRPLARYFKPAWILALLLKIINN